MKGSVYQKPANMKWYPYIFDKESGKKKWGSGYSKKSDAEKALRVMLKDYDAGKIVFKKSDSFQNAYNEWKELIAPTVYTTPSSLSSSICYMETHVLPSFKNKQINKITPSECQKLFHGMLSVKGEELAPASKKKILGIMNSFFGAVIEWGYVSENPCSKVRLKPVVQKEMEVWNNEQLGYFLEYVSDTKYYLPFLILATTGMRRGEVCALQWKCFNGSDIVLAKSMDKNGDLTDMKTKSSHRKVTLMQITIDAINKQKEVQEKVLSEISNKSRITKFRSQDDYICTNEWNEHIMPENLTCEFRRFIIKNNNEYNAETNKRKKAKMMELPIIRLHDLRHGFATYALSSGENVKVVSEILGHAKTSTTSNIYSHATETMQKATVGRMENVMFMQKSENTRKKKVSEK